ncbi:ABC transporter ATP-binding protein [Nonomuraea sp. NPDC046570]|uniref:ABC transporter ATP-binding protein n=1 Tax=Nonomuraea sp. NPDC046570 TaxID=3155255 RepID=UPI0033CDB04D
MTTEQLVADAGTGLDGAIRVAELRQNYGAFEAVRGISFEVRSGELFALLGTNGAGKTTTMEVLEGYARPAGGSVEVLGLDPVRDRRALRPRIGIMLQEAGFLGDLTVAETVAMGLGLVADTGRTPMDGDPLAAVGLTGKARTRVRQLSGGEKRRLDLALAILSRPEVLFLDEPTTGMDPAARQATWKVIGDLRERGTTVLLTTHYLEEAERLADRLAIMHGGLIHTYGTVEEVVATTGDQISFRLPYSVEDLPVVGGAAPVVRYAEGRTEAAYTVYGGTERSHAALRPLLSWADRHELTLERLEVRPGTLEDVFLRVVEESK